MPMKLREIDMNGAPSFQIWGTLEGTFWHAGHPREFCFFRRDKGLKREDTMTTTQTDPRLTVRAALDEETARTLDMLICYELLTPDGRDLTEAGRFLMESLIRKYTQIHLEYIMLLRHSDPDAAKYTMLVTLASCAKVGDMSIPEGFGNNAS